MNIIATPRNRYALALIPAGTVTLGVFWLMNTLISNGVPALVEDTPLPAIEIIRKIEDTTSPPRQPQLPDKPDIQPRPNMPLPDLAKTDLDSGTGMSWTRPKTSPDTITIKPTGNALEGAPIPLVRQPPVYPSKQAQRGIEGWVRLVFDITATGAVDKIRVVDEDPIGAFGRAATKALSRWRYKPEIRDGRPIRRTDVEVVITFSLDHEK